MDCDKAIYRVYGYLDGELTVWRRWTIRRHLDKCLRTHNLHRAPGAIRA